MRKLIKNKLLRLRQDLGLHGGKNATIDKETLVNIVEYAIQYMASVEPPIKGEEEKFKMQILDPDTFVYKYDLESDTSEWIVDLVNNCLGNHVSFDIVRSNISPMVNDDGTVSIIVYSENANNSDIRYKHTITIRTDKR
jgi:hypothetical protein